MRIEADVPRDPVTEEISGLIKPLINRDRDYEPSGDVVSARCTLMEMACENLCKAVFRIFLRACGWKDSETL